MLIDVILYFIFNTKVGQTMKVFARRNNFEKDKLVFVARKYTDLNCKGKVLFFF